MPHEPWPLRKSDMVFVLTVVMLVFAVPGPAAAVLAAGAVLAWIRFRVYGGRDQRNSGGD